MHSAGGGAGPGGLVAVLRRFFVADFLDFGFAQFAFFEFFFGFFAGAFGEFFFPFVFFEFAQFTFAFFEFAQFDFASEFFFEGGRCGAQGDWRRVRGARREQQDGQDEGESEDLQFVRHGRTIGRERRAL